MTGRRTNVLTCYKMTMIVTRKSWTGLVASYMNQETVNSVIFTVLTLPIPPLMVPLIFGTIWRKNTQMSMNGLPNQELETQTTAVVGISQMSGGLVPELSSSSYSPVVLPPG